MRLIIAKAYSFCPCRTETVLLAAPRYNVALLFCVYNATNASF